MLLTDAHRGTTKCWSGRHSTVLAETLLCRQHYGTEVEVHEQEARGTAASRNGDRNLSLAAPRLP
jgi:hypothetical protein